MSNFNDQGYIAINELFENVTKLMDIVDANEELLYNPFRNEIIDTGYETIQLYLSRRFIDLNFMILEYPDEKMAEIFTITNDYLEGRYASLLSKTKIEHNPKPL